MARPPATPWSVRAQRTLFDLHGYVGIGCGLLLCVILWGGAISLFRDPLTAWQTTASSTEPCSGCIGPLLAEASRSHDLRGAQVDLEWNGKDGAALLRVRPKGEEKRYLLLLDGHSGEVRPMNSRLADLFFYLHFLYLDGVQYGTYVAGFVGLGFVLSLLTGFLIHLKDLLPRLYQYRPRERARVVFGDLHRVLGVFGLPFQALFAVTGTLIAIQALLLATVGAAALGSEERAEAWLLGPKVVSKPSGKEAPPLPAESLLAQAVADVPSLEVNRLRFSSFGDAASTVSVRGRDPSALLGQVEVVLRSSTGELLSVNRPRELVRWIKGTHFVRMGGLLLRGVLSLLALAALATVLSGNWIWIERQRIRGWNRRAYFMERMTAVVGPGLWLASSVAFLLNRALPNTFWARSHAEVIGFFAAWTLAGVVAFRAPTGTAAWVTPLSAGALVSASVSLTSAAVGGWSAQTWGVDAVLLSAGAFLFFLSKRMGRGVFERSVADEPQPEREAA